MMLKQKRTPAQIQRQEYRTNGKYTQVNPCYVCGKSAGINYRSHPDTDRTINDELLCLCRQCYNKLASVSGQKAIEIAFGYKEG